MSQSCKNCRHAKFSTGPAGECLAPSPVTGPRPDAIVVHVMRLGIGPGDGMTCPAWMPVDRHDR